MDNFLAWAHARDVHVHESIDLAQPGPFGSQGIAIANIPANSTLCSIPFATCITPVAAAAEFHVPFETIMSSDLEASILALYLVQQRNKSSSVWAPYIASLPDTFDTPHYWTVFELEYFKGTNLYGEVARREQEWKTQRRSLASLVPAAEHLLRDEDEWRWAMTILSSRSFPSALIGASHSYPILLPVLDSLNHAPIPITWSTDSSTSTISFINSTEIPAKSQVYNNYGAKNSDAFILGYGFYGGIDTFTLKLSHSQNRYYITKDAPVPEDMLRVLSDMRGAGYVFELVELKDLLSLKAEIISSVIISGDSDRAKVATLYRNGQLDVLNNSLTTLSRKIEESQKNALSVVTAMRDEAFALGFSQCFGQPHDSASQELVLALYMMHANVELGSAQFHEEQEAEVADIWSEIQACRTIAPVIFGRIDYSIFRRAMSRVWLRGVEIKQVLHIFAD